VSRFRILFLSVLVLGLAIAPAAAGQYPQKVVDLIVPYSPGGAADISGRNLATYGSRYLGKNMVVVNQNGAGGAVGATFVAKAKNDGYTLLVSRVGSNAAVPAINKKIAYNWDDFTFISLLEVSPFVLTVNANSPYKTFNELKAALLKGGSFSYSSAGVGNLQHLGVVMLADELGVPQRNLKHIPFKGGGNAAAAAVGGHVQIFFQDMSGVINYIESGKLRALAVTTPERSPMLPNVPTFRELGYPEMETILGWTGLFGPKNLPEDVVAVWGKTLQKLSADKQWLKAVDNLGSTPRITSPADTKAFVGKQYTKFSKLVQKLNLEIK